MDFGTLGPVLMGVLTGLGIIWLYERYKKFLLFRHLGIPGPTPHIISGNSHDVRSGSTKPVHSQEKWIHQFGNVFGYYRGTDPILVVKDLELVKRIAIKDFNHFHDRVGFPFSTPPLCHSLVQIKGQHWKNVRKLLTPTFSTSKMKQLTSVINQHVSAFVEEIDRMAELHEEFDIYDRFQRLTLDVIGECALAMKVNSQRHLHDSYYNSVKTLMKTGGGKLARWVTYFPVFRPLLRFLYLKFSTRAKATEQPISNLRSVIEQRRAMHNKQAKTIDVLQLMLDSECILEKSARYLENSDSIEPQKITIKTEKHVLTDDEIIANCWMFVLAGFETTATALAYAAHVLTVHSDIQEKLFHEITTNIEANKIPTYEDAHNLQYLDQVINEALRLYPPVVLFMTRVCAQDYDLNGIKIPAGMKVEIPIYSIHHDPDIWPDPEKFDPERFSPENRNKIHPMAHIPFGAGPRNCIGMRFALLEAKLALIRLIKEYRLIPSSRTKEPPEITVPHSTFIPKHGIYLKVERRN